MNTEKLEQSIQTSRKLKMSDYLMREICPLPKDQEQLRSIALEVGFSADFVAMFGDKLSDFLAAVQEKAEPVAWYHVTPQGEVKFTTEQPSWPESVWPPLFTHPSFEQESPVIATLHKRDGEADTLYETIIRRRDLCYEGIKLYARPGFEQREGEKK